MERRVLVMGKKGEGTGDGREGCWCAADGLSLVHGTLLPFPTLPFFSAFSFFFSSAGLGVSVEALFFFEKFGNAGLGRWDWADGG